MSDYEVESGKEAPRPGRGNRLKYPWLDMTPGDSFTVPCGEEDPAKVRHKLYGASYSWRRRNAPHLHAVTEIEENKKGEKFVRIWHLEAEDEE